MSFLARLVAGCLVLGTLAVFLAGVAAISLYRFSDAGSTSGAWSLPTAGASGLVAAVDIDRGDVTIADSLPAAPPVPPGTALQAEYRTGEDVPIVLEGSTSDGIDFATIGSAGAEPPIVVLRWLRSPVEATWDVGLNPSVPVDLSVDVAVGEVRLDLTGLTASRFDIRIGGGEAHVTLGSAVPAGGGGRIQVGVGDVELAVPEEAPVRIRVTAGLGNVFPDGFTFDGLQYTNAAFDALLPPEQARVPEIVVEAGTGDVRLTTLRTVVAAAGPAGPGG